MPFSFHFFENQNKLHIFGFFDKNWTQNRWFLFLWKLTSDGKPLVFATSLPPCHLVLVLLIIPKLSPQVFLLWSEVIAWVCKLGQAIHSDPFLRDLILNSTKMFYTIKVTLTLVIFLSPNLEQSTLRSLACHWFRNDKCWMLNIEYLLLLFSAGIYDIQDLSWPNDDMMTIAIQYWMPIAVARRTVKLFQFFLMNFWVFLTAEAFYCLVLPRQFPSGILNFRSLWYTYAGTGKKAKVHPNFARWIINPIELNC